MRVIDNIPSSRGAAAPVGTDRRAVRERPCSAPSGRALPVECPDEGGFTLIEVLVALVIFAFSGVMLSSAYVNMLAAHQTVLQRDVLASDRHLVREALYAEPSLDKVRAWNELTLPGDRFARWRATVTTTTVADLFDVALEIELTADDGKIQPVLTETCRLLRPTWSQPADRETLRAAARSKLAQRTFQ